MSDVTDNDNAFLGRGWGFPPEFSKYDRGVTMVAGETDISQSLEILFSTYRMERVMLPEYGCLLIEFLFEDIDSTLLTQLQDRIENAILYFEPRITLNNVNIDSSNSREGLLYIELDYTIKLTNSRNNSVYPYYISEGNLLSRPDIL